MQQTLPEMISDDALKPKGGGPDPEPMRKAFGELTAVKLLGGKKDSSLKGIEGFSFPSVKYQAGVRGDTAGEGEKHLPLHHDVPMNIAVFQPTNPCSLRMFATRLAAVGFASWSKPRICCATLERTR